MDNDHRAVLRQWHFRAMHLRVLVAQMLSYADAHEASPAYSAKQMELLKWARGLCVQLAQRLGQFLETVDGFDRIGLIPRSYEDLETQIRTIANDFLDTHVLIKLISPASVFNIPSPLVLSLRDLARKVKHGVSLLMIPLPSYNYGQLRRWRVPDEFCLLSMPYSGHQDLLAGTILFHELGHFVAQSLAFPGMLVARAPQQIDEATLDIMRELRRALGPGAGSSSSLRGRARNIIYGWCEEAFADCFALHCAGPAYTAAMLSFPWPAVPEGDAMAYTTHPPLENRISLLLRCDRDLRLHKLWEEDAAWILLAAQRLARSTRDVGPLASRCWHHLSNLFPAVDSVLEKTHRDHPELAFNVRRFVGEREKVNAYLCDLTTAGQVLWKSTFVPEWRTILNVAWEIAVAGFKEWHPLFERLGDEAETHVVFADKLCALGLKSIEDSMICRMWEGADSVRFGP